MKTKVFKHLLLTLMLWAPIYSFSQQMPKVRITTFQNSKVSIDLTNDITFAKDSAQEFTLKPGEHYIEAVSVDGQQQWDTVIYVNYGDIVEIKLFAGKKTVQAKASVIFIAKSPCKLYIDGNKVSRLQKHDKIKIDLPLGTHTIKAKINGRWWSQQLEINDTTQKVIVIDLTPSAQNYIETCCGLNMEFSLIPGGTFNMGSSEGENDEKPVHQVTLKQFSMAKHEVTIAQFEKFVQETGYITDAEKNGRTWILNGGQWLRGYDINWRYDENGSPRTCSQYNNPVIYVSWNDAVAFANWLSQKTGKNYRLPTEAEWEYAAGGGAKHQKWAGTNSKSRLPLFANYDSSHFRNKTTKTLPVGTLKPNLFGLYDMSGNVWEWCLDWYDSDFYKTSSAVDPSGPATGTRKVIRGGAWNTGADECRVANRKSAVPQNSSCSLGFRLVLEK